jgi:hypothetical protein
MDSIIGVLVLPDSFQHEGIPLLLRINSALHHNAASPLHVPAQCPVSFCLLSIDYCLLPIARCPLLIGSLTLIFTLHLLPPHSF